MKKLFLRDLIDFVALTTKSLEEDDFTKCFEPISPFEMDHSGVLYIFSFIIRYTLLFPCRFFILMVSTALFVLMNLLFSFLKLKTEILFFLYCKALLFAFGARIHHHGNKKRIYVPHVYVSNHTSFVDYIILSSYKFSHSCISENHGGLFGFLLNMLRRNNGSIGFKRSEKQDREAVFCKMKKHAYTLDSVPMIIFPEGTCVNNKYTVLFQKGAFNLDCAVVPVAIKYRSNLMDPYWNRRRYGFTEQIFYMLTRWKLEADVWWMEETWRGDVYTQCVLNTCEPENSVHECICERLQNNLIQTEKNEPDQDLIVNPQKICSTDPKYLIHDFYKEIAKYETPSEFSMRVKELISEKGGLRSVLWNGYFKSSPVLRDREILREAYRNVFRDRTKLRIVRKEKVIGEHRFRKIIAPNVSFKGEQTKDRNILINESNETKALGSYKNNYALQSNSTTNTLVNIKEYKNSSNKYKKNIGHNKLKYQALNTNSSNNIENIYFSCFTYNEYIEHVLKEYLMIKREQHSCQRIGGLWFGNIESLHTNECESDSNKEHDDTLNNQKA